MKKGKVVAVIGSMWGDEGKGKITNYLSEKAEMVVRCAGGDNAGHTIVLNGETFRLHLVPSGIFNPRIKNVLANGMVVNPRHLLKEIQDLQKAGVPCANLYVGERAHVIFDVHLELDELREQARGKNKIGTTKKGIGPAYDDKVTRRGVRIVDFVSPNFKEIYRSFLEEHNKEIVALGGTPIDFASSYADYVKIADALRPYVVDSVYVIRDAIDRGEKIVMEGAQGALLDIDFGTYPFVTSSNPTIGGVCVGSGVSVFNIGAAVGITKAYCTRVGEGAFPTEMRDELGDRIREKGREYGTTTKRPRRIGWLDAVALKYSVEINGFTSLALMLLDVLTGIPTLKIATSYKLDGQITRRFPSQNETCLRCEPQYIELPGWTEDITGCRRFEDLPLNARNYVAKVEEIIGVPVDFLSVGPDKEATIARRDIFAE